MNVKDVLGFPHTIDDSRIGSDAVVDIASPAA
jgi:hypothetical protein